jgi:hypothetical protein
MTEKKNPKPNHILVAVVTTAGTYPAEGFDDVPINQPVKVILQHASKELGITNTTDWIAVVAGRELEIERDYVANNLTGEVSINWGPRETGGGNGW